jgi:GWxTD domain-containing protein
VAARSLIRFVRVPASSRHGRSPRGGAMRKVSIALFLLLTVLPGPTAARAQELPDLFRQLKQRVSAGSWAEAMTSIAALESEAARPGFEQSRHDLEGPIRFYRGVCEANLGRTDEAVADFEAFLKIRPDAVIDPAVHSEKAVATFERARARAATRPSSMEEAYEEFRPPADAADRDPVDRHWADGPVKWIMTDEEKRAWSDITDPNDRVAFVEWFWQSRSILNGTDGLTFREEFQRRVAFADSHLGQEGEPRGSLTDRGMVFVLMGPPTYASRRPLRTGDDQSDNAGKFVAGSQDAKLAEKGMGTRPGGKIAVLKYQNEEPGNTAVETDGEVEIWRYRGARVPAGVPYQQVDVHYVTKKGYGDHVMQRDPEAINTLRAAAKQIVPRNAPRNKFRPRSGDPRARENGPRRDATAPEPQ